MAKKNGGSPAVPFVVALATVPAAIAVGTIVFKPSSDANPSDLSQASVAASSESAIPTTSPEGKDVAPPEPNPEVPPAAEAAPPAPPAEPAQEPAPPPPPAAASGPRPMEQFAQECVVVTLEWCGYRLQHAYTIVDVGRQMGIPPRGWVIAIGTVMQETKLRNLATEVYPVTKSYPHDGIGADHDSVGLFQQRPAMGWGTPQELMDPRIAAERFYNALRRVVNGWPGWEDPKQVALTDIAQAVQKSCCPLAYQQWEDDAVAVVDYVLSFMA